MPSSAEPLNLLLLIPIGIAVLVVVRLVFGPRETDEVGPLRRILTSAGLLLIAGGLIGILIGMSSGLAILNGMVVSAVTVSTLQWLRDSNREGLLWALTVAAERNLPLHQAAWAFASEQRDTSGSRAWQLGDLLGRGASLPEAMELVRYPASMDIKLAARVGQSLGCLPQMLREALDAERDVRVRVRPLVQHFYYLGGLLTAIALTATFLSVKILPVFEKMLSNAGIDFDDSFAWGAWFRNLPDEVSFRFGGFPVPVQGLFVIALGLSVLALLACGFLYSFRLVPSNLPGLRWVMLPLDRTRVLRMLAWCVRSGRPLQPSLHTISALYPRGNVAGKLKRAAASMERGIAWAESLRQTGLIRPSDVAVLRAAEQAGNLEWGLREMAERNLRRLLYRLDWWRSILIPITLSIAGVMVGLIGWTVLYPLVLMLEASNQ